MTGEPHDELVAAAADAILADADAAEAYAEHFEGEMRVARLAVQMCRGRVRRLLALLRVFRRPGVILLVVSLIPGALFGYAAVETSMTRVPAVGPSGTNGLAAVTTVSGRLAGVTPLPGPPGAVSAADGSVWVADPGAGQVSRIEPGTRAGPVRIPVAGEPGAIASGSGAIWVADTGGAAVTRIDPATERVTRTIILPWAHPGAIAFGAGRVWVADPAARQLAEIDPATGSLERTLSVDLRPSAIAAVGQAIWVAGYDTATVEKLAAASGRVLARIRVGAGPVALTVGGGSLWVASSLDATVSRIDLATLAVTAIVSVGQGPAALVAGPGSVWVADQGSGTISRIDPRTDEVTASVGVPGAPTSLAIAGSSVWTGIQRTAVRPMVGLRLGTVPAGLPVLFGRRINVASDRRGHPSDDEPPEDNEDVVALAAARSGDTATARAALDWITERTRVTPTEWALGIEAMIRALLSEGATAERHYRESIERLGRTRVRAQLARSHLLYGEWLRRENRRQDARTQLRIAHDMLSAMGAGAFAERARRELLAAGDTVRKRAAETVSELTAQEAHIARLAVEGRTNPEIGAQLFLSARTVEWHLRKVYTKLGVGSRRELRSALVKADQADSQA